MSRDVIIYTCETSSVTAVTSKYGQDLPSKNLVTICPCIRDVDGFVSRIKSFVGSATQRVIVISHGTSNDGLGLMKLNASGKGNLLTAKAMHNHKEWSIVKTKLKNKDLFLLGCNTANTTQGATVVSFDSQGKRTQFYRSISHLFQSTCKNTYTVHGKMFQGPAKTSNDVKLAFGSPTNYKTLFEIISNPQKTPLVRNNNF